MSKWRQRKMSSALPTSKKCHGDRVKLATLGVNYAEIARAAVQLAVATDGASINAIKTMVPREFQCGRLGSPGFSQWILRPQAFEEEYSLEGSFSFSRTGNRTKSIWFLPAICD